MVCQRRSSGCRVVTRNRSVLSKSGEESQKADRPMGNLNFRITGAIQPTSMNLPFFATYTHLQLGFIPSLKACVRFSFRSASHIRPVAGLSLKLIFHHLPAMLILAPSETGLAATVTKNAAEQQRYLSNSWSTNHAAGVVLK